VPVFAYANNGPLKSIDPDGLFVISPGVKAKCANYDDSLKAAREALGCDENGKQVASCECEATAKRCGLSSIADACRALQDKEGPRVVDVTSAGPNEAEHGRLFGYSWVNFDKDACTMPSRKSILTASMIHEVLHEIGSTHSDDDCDTEEIRKKCFKQ